MEFGYFTLSDNHYENNPRDANQFVSDIAAEALYADQLGMHSAWIGEHHFNSLGVLSCPDLVLAYIAARTKHIPGEALGVNPHQQIGFAIRIAHDKGEVFFGVLVVGIQAEVELADIGWDAG